MKKKIELPTLIREYVKELLNNMQQSLSDDPKFFKDILVQFLEIGKSIYWENVRSVIYKQYPDLFKQESGYVLVQSGRKLSELLCLTSQDIPTEIKEMPDEDRDEFRSLLEQIVCEYANIAIAAESIDLIGDNTIATDNN